MSKIAVLYSSAEIHAKIKHLFGQPGRGDRRVAIVAYVGSDGEAYLPHPKGLRVICSPSPGGTDPDTLRRLIQRGAVVKFSDGLHMKVYWSRHRGCLITSANASSSALGARGLKEAGVWFSPGIVDVDKLIRYARPRKLTPGELRKLDRKTREHTKNIKDGDMRNRRAPDFLTWYGRPHHSDWKLAWAGTEVSGTARVAKEQTLGEYGRKEPFTWWSVGRDRVRRNDWLLSFMFTNGGVRSVEWMYVDFLVKITPRDKRFYSRKRPFHAVQVHARSKYPLPPFRITPDFRKALNRAIKRFTDDKIIEAKSDVPPLRLLKLIAEEMKNR